MYVRRLTAALAAAPGRRRGAPAQAETDASADPRAERCAARLTQTWRSSTCPRRLRRASRTQRTRCISRPCCVRTRACTAVAPLFSVSQCRRTTLMIRPRCRASPRYAGDSRQVYHPNLDLEGHVCLNILREEWNPILTLNSVLVGLLFLFLEPNPGDPLNKGACYDSPRRRRGAPSECHGVCCRREKDHGRWLTAWRRVRLCLVGYSFRLRVK